MEVHQQIPIRMLIMEMVPVHNVHRTAQPVQVQLFVQFVPQVIMSIIIFVHNVSVIANNVVILQIVISVRVIIGHLIVIRRS